MYLGQLVINEGPVPRDGDVLEFEALAPTPGRSLVAVVASPARSPVPGSPARSPGTTEIGDIEAAICIPLQTPVIKAAPILRRSRTPATVVTLKRSTRLAAKPRAANATLQAQSVLMRKLGIPVQTPPADLDALGRYIAAFNEPPTPTKEEALQALFSPEFDAVAMNLNMVDLEEGEL
jgi:hypothetical protein